MERTAGACASRTLHVKHRGPAWIAAGLGAVQKSREGLRRGPPGRALPASRESHYRGSQPQGPVFRSRSCFTGNVPAPAQDSLGPGSTATGCVPRRAARRCGLSARASLSFPFTHRPSNSTFRDAHVSREARSVAIRMDRTRPSHGVIPCLTHLGGSDAVRQPECCT